jgi:hypothetical protein
VTSRLFRKSFNCRYNPRMDYAFCLLTLESSEHWQSPLFGATCNFNDQILPYSILFLTFINTNVFIYCHLNFHANLLRPWRFPLTLDILNVNLIYKVWNQCTESSGSMVSILYVSSFSSWKIWWFKRFYQ